MTSVRTVPEMQILESAPPLALSYLPGTSDTLVISFSDVGLTRKEQPRRAFQKTASRGGENHVLFVSDRSRSWMNGPDLADRIVAAVEMTVEKSKASRVVALGNSMGGSMALLLAGLTRVDTVLAISPQFSVHPDCVPEESRWKIFRSRITDWRFKSIDVLPPISTQTIILHGGTADECVHLDKFATNPSTRHFVFPTLDHNLAKILKQRKQLAPIVDRAILGRPWFLRRAIARAGGIPRAQFDVERQGNALKASQE